MEQYILCLLYFVDQSLFLFWHIYGIITNVLWVLWENWVDIIHPWCYQIDFFLCFTERTYCICQCFFSTARKVAIYSIEMFSSSRYFKIANWKINIFLFVKEAWNIPIFFNFTSYRGSQLGACKDDFIP